VCFGVLVHKRNFDSAGKPGKNANLKPLRPNPYGTNRWTFGGKPLPKEELQALTDRGVIAQDWMPDGRLKLPKFQKRWGDWQKIKRISLSQIQAERWQRYQALSEPRPDYMEWAASDTRKDCFEELEKVAKTASRKIDRVKAINVILDYTKRKPKQELEHSGELAEFSHLSNQDLLRMVLEMNGIRPEVFERFRELNPATPTQ